MSKKNNSQFGTRKKTNNKVILFLILILLLSFLLRLFLAHEFRLDNDEGNFLYDASLVLEDKTPYKDFWSRSPIIFYFLAFSVKLFGHTLLAGRLVSVLAVTLTTFFLFLIGRKLYNSTIGLLVALVFSFVPSTLFFLSIIKMEPLEIMFLTISIFFYLKYYYDDNNLFIFLSGVFVSLAIFTRFSCIFVAPMLFFLTFYKYKQRDRLAFDWKKLINSQLLYILGFLLVAIPIITYFAFAAGLAQAYAMITIDLSSSSLLNMFIRAVLAFGVFLSLHGFFILPLILTIIEQAKSFSKSKKLFSSKSRKRIIITSYIFSLLIILLVFLNRHFIIDFLSSFFNVADSNAFNVLMTLFFYNSLLVLSLSLLSLIMFFASTSEKKIVFIKSKDVVRKYLPLLWFGSIFLFYLFFGFSFNYLIELTVPVCLFIAIIFERLYTLKKKSLLTAFSVFMVLLFVLSLLINCLFWIGGPGLQKSLAEEVDEYIEINTLKGEKVLSISTIYVFLADRKLVSDIFINPSLIDKSGDYSTSQGILSILENEPINYVLVDPYFLSRLSQNQMLMNFIDENYHQEQFFSVNDYWYVKVLKLND